MNTRILWVLLCLLTLGARAQTPVTLAQETFEGISTDFGYASNPFAISAVEYFERRAFNTDGTYSGTTQALSNRQGSYTWTGEGVRGTGATTTRSAGYVVLNPINTQNYRNIAITVALAAPRGGSYAGAGANSVATTDRIRIQYSFNGGPFVTAGLLLGNNGTTGDFQQDISAPLDSIPDAAGVLLDQQFRDVSVSVPATGSSLRVRVVLDMRSVELAFDNIRVTGVLDNTARPTLSALESTAASYTEGGTPVQLTNTLQVGYSDNSATALTSATVRIANYIAGQDVLNFTNQGTITGSYSSANGTLTLSGTSSQAAYQAALRSVTYSNNNTTTANGVTRQIEFQVANGATLSNNPTRNVAVTLVLNPPASLPYTENFDTDGENTRYFGNSFYNANSLAGFFRATTNPPAGTTTTYGGTSGGFWYGEGTTLGSNPTAPLSTLQLAPVSAAGASNLRLVIALGKNNNWKSNSFFRLYYRVNGGSQVLFGAFYGVNTTGELRRDADLDGVADATGTSLTPTLQDVTFDIAGAAVGNLTFELVQRADVTEEIAFDNIRVLGAVSPTVTTAAATNLTATSATLGGTLTSDGGGPLTDYGVVYVAGTGTPTTSNTKVSAGTNSPATFPSTFSANATGLTAGTTYTVRAYATNGAGTSYGSAVTFTTPTTVVAISTTGANPTNAASVAYTVTFATSVSGLSISNFYTVAMGLTGVGISSLVGGGTTYTVSVSTGSGSGTLRLDLINSTGISPSVSNVPFSGSTYTIDKAAPTVTLSSATASGGVTTSSPLAFTASFSESVSGFSASGINVTNGTVTSGPTGSGPTYTFQITPTTPNTATTVTVLANAAQDAATNGNSASASYSLTYSVPITSTTWTGTISSDWFTAGNWTAGVPTATVDATVSAGTPFSPALASGNATTRNLTLNGSATLAMSGGTLDVRANFTNNGTFVPTGGTVVVGTTVATNILGAGRIRFWNLTVDANGLLLSTSAGASVQRLATLTGAFATQGNSFTLESSSTNTALLVNNGSTGSISGNVTVQRYLSPAINAGLGYRHLSAPVSTATVGSLATGSFTPVVNPAYNASAQPGAVMPFPTVYGYDQSRLASTTNNLGAFDKGWFSPSTLTAPLAVGQGYTVNLGAGQTVSFTGPLNNASTQPITLNLARNAAGSAGAADAGWALVGNPFPAPLDYSLVAAADRVGLDPAIYVFESSGQYTGSYRASLNGVGGNDNSANSLLALGQGFFVRVSDGFTSGTLNFRNSQRVTSYQNPALLRTAETRPLVQLSLQGIGSALTDAAYVYFDNEATAGFEPAYDAVKLPNTTGLNLSTSAGGKQLAIDGQAVLGTTQRLVPLALGVPAPGTYTLTTAQLLNLPDVPVYLRDVQTGALIDLAQQPSYQFTVSDASALITNRFELVFSPQQSLVAAPVALVQQVMLYPNPATTSAWLELPASLGRQAITATLLDAVGRAVRTLTLPAQGSAAHQLDLYQLPAGIYALRLHTSAGVVVKKLAID